MDDNCSHKGKIENRCHSCLCNKNLDGEMNKTNKSTLFKALEDRIEHRPPRHTDAFIVDGFYFLHLCPGLPATFGKAARHILERLLRATQAKRIHLVFDRIISPSIKDADRDKRTYFDRDLPFKIVGEKQLRPNDFIKAMRNNNFKRELVAFLLKSWSDNSVVGFFGDKVLYVTNDQSCFSFRANNGKIEMKEEASMRSVHEEADSLMISHLQSIPCPSNVVIRTCDTDVLAIALENVSKIDRSLHLWLEVGPIITIALST